MSKHTPGSWWLYISHDARPHEIYPAMGFGPIKVEHCGYLNAKDLRGEIEANARLIASAPELLDALIGVVRVADRATVEFDAARAVIAKATGES